MASRPTTKVALLLTGCGHLDGTDLHEATAMQIHLSRANCEVTPFAPYTQQRSVKCHETGDEKKEYRTQPAESARISRRKAESIRTLKAEDFDAILIPGGYGVGLNLSDYYISGPMARVSPQTKRVIKDFHASRKPIGMSGLAPILAASALEDQQLSPAITLGSKEGGVKVWPESHVIRQVDLMGAMHVTRDIDGIEVDARNKLVSAPAYLKATAQPHEVYDNVGQLIEAVLQLVEENMNEKNVKEENEETQD